jgi:peptide/nickel transport system ATP-binding protein
VGVTFGRVIQIDGLTVRLNGRTALERVSLTVAPGERVGLTGASGSGKSLTALACLGLLPAGAQASGRVLVGGRALVGGHVLGGPRDVLAMRRRELARLRGDRVAMLSQAPMNGLDPGQRIGRQIMHAVRRHRGLSRTEARDRAVALLRRVEVAPEASGACPRDLPAWQLQRVALALALARDPATLICDEPATALDARLLELIDWLVTERRTGLLLISRDVDVVSRMCGRTVELRGGRVVRDGPLAEVMERPDADAG